MFNPCHVLDVTKICTFYLQTITGAMSTLTPPISLEKPENQARVDYIQDYASSMFLFMQVEFIMI